MIQKIGIIGAGQMGSGIAQVCVTAGFEVFITDTNEDRFENAREFIERDLNRQVARNKLSDQDMAEALDRLQNTKAMEDFQDCDLILEAVTEDEHLKKQIFADLNDVVTPDTLLATNTSSISITGLASVLDNPARFIGVHFMHPVPIIPFVEVIRGLGTSDETFTEIDAFLEKLGKSYAISQDYPGFIVNRLLMPMINEACYALFEGVGTIEAIDKGMKLGTNHPMGPFELADLIGLDTCYYIMQVLHRGLNGAKYQPCPLLLNYVEAGWLGRKSGRGFYDYGGETPIPTR